MTDQDHTITLTKNQAQALMLHASKDADYRPKLCSVAISSDGIAMTTQGHTMFTIRPEDSDADPRKHNPDRKWIVLTRSAVDQAIKLASAKQSIRIDGTTREVSVLDDETGEVASFPAELAVSDGHAYSVHQIFPSPDPDERAQRWGINAGYLKLLGDTAHKLKNGPAHGVVWSTPLDSLQPSTFEIVSDQRDHRHKAEIVVMPMRI